MLSSGSENSEDNNEKESHNESNLDNQNIEITGGESNEGTEQSLPQNAESVAKQFLDAMINLDSQGVVNLSTEKFAEEAKLSTETLAAMNEGSDDKYSFAYKLLKVEGDESKAKATYVFVSKKGYKVNEDNGTLNLLKVDGVWLVDSAL